MYLALFLTPWILMYALAVFGGNHQNLFRSDGPAYVRFEKEKEQAYQAVFSEDVNPGLVAEQILADLDLEGTYIVRKNQHNGTYLILRRDPVTPRRITYDPGGEKLIIERQIFGTMNFLQGLHHRQSYRHKNLMDDSWAFSVDLAIAGMIFWVLSGLWIWWGLKGTRKWGLVSLIIGAGLFVFFVLAI